MADTIPYTADPDDELYVTYDTEMWPERTSALVRPMFEIIEDHDPYCGFCYTAKVTGGEVQ